MSAKDGNTLDRILDTAESLMQTRGYNAFSFRDLAKIIEIKPASVHYYFQNKGDLGKALVMRYSKRFETARDSLDRLNVTSAEKLDRYVDLLSDGFQLKGRMCLCGVLAAEASTLPSDVVEEVRTFFVANETWLATLLESGRQSGDLRFEGAAIEAAQSLFAALEGALMSAWTFSSNARLNAAGKWLVASLKT